MPLLDMDERLIFKYLWINRGQYPHSIYYHSELVQFLMQSSLEKLVLA